MVDDQGHLYVVGSNDDRQLGRTITDKFSGPQQVSIPNKVVAVACGHQHTIVLTDKGQVYASGMGDSSYEIELFILLKFSRTW
jgi:alpha-tubulin suppressor-like RCC1 family protein